MAVLDASPAPLQTTRLGRHRPLRPILGLAGSFRSLTRPRRVLLAIAAIWIISVLDLGYTLLESLHSGFIELNPVAARLIGESTSALVGYKLALLLVSSTVLLICRRHRVAELSCWFLLTVYAYVAVCWCLYYEHRLASFDDPATNVDPLIGCYLPLPG